MTNFVIDSSFLLSYLLPDEHIGQVQKIFDALKINNIQLIAPLLLYFEIFNGLKMAFLRKRVDLEVAEQLGKRFLKIPIKYEEIDYNKALSLSVEKNLTFYDACYFYLSQKYDLELLTLDDKLKKLA